jgi:translation initiation factor IF-2
LASTKVYILAKELGVKSTAIVEKCQAENIAEVKTHMSVISAGLAATIREWFSDGEHTTAIETGQKVDLEKVRIKRPKTKPAPAKMQQDKSAELMVEVPQPQVAQPVVETPVVPVAAVTAETMHDCYDRGKAGRGQTRGEKTDRTKT